MKKLLLALVGAAACLSASATDYELITSAGELIPGDNYLLVGKKGDAVYTLGTQSTNNFQAALVTANGNTITINDEAVKIVTLGQSASDSYPYTLAVDGKYLYAASTGSNHMKTTDDATLATANASIEIAADGVATIKFNQSARNWVRFNSTNNPPLFSCYTSGQADVYLYKEVTSVAEVAKPVFSVASGIYTEAFSVAITCETEGASIYYTTDDTEPTAASTAYTGEINITATTTLKAIAVKDDKTSAVTTAVYTFPARYASMAALLQAVEMPANNKTSDPFVVDFPAVVTYVNGGNVYFSDNGTPGLIFKYDTGLNPGDVIAAGWIGHLKNYNTLPELEPESDLTSTETTDAPEPVAFTGMDNLVVNSIVKIEGVTFDAATPGTDATGAARNFTGTWGEAELAFYNQFKVASVEAGKYNVTAVVGSYNGNIQLQPTAYAEYVEPIEAGATIYYVLPVKDMDVADNTDEVKFVPTEGYPWWQIESITQGTGEYGNLPEANVWTLKVPNEIVVEAASCGWMARDFDGADLRAKDYDLLFSVKTTSAATMAVKLVAVDGNEGTGNEVQFSAENNGQWQDVRMNLHELFPNFVKADATVSSCYVFAFVAGAGLQGGDIFEVTNVRYVPAGTTDPEPQAPFACPDHFYMIGNIDGNEFSTTTGVEMAKHDDTNSFTYIGHVTGNGYFGFVTALTAEENQWDELNANRWGAVEDGTAVVPGTDLVIEKATGALRLATGEYNFTVVFDVETETVTLSVESLGSPIEVPEHLYVIGNVNGIGWNPSEGQELTREDNTFTIEAEVTGDSNFAFGTVLSSDWGVFNANRWGAPTDNELVETDATIALSQNENAIRLEPGNYLLTVVFGETEVTFTATESVAIDVIEADAAEAEYYNLQGVRVDNPASGLYIRVSEGKAAKVLVK